MNQGFEPRQVGDYTRKPLFSFKQRNVFLFKSFVHLSFHYQLSGKIIKRRAKTKENPPQIIGS